jgi:uncharacterized membrane protein YfcA
MFFPSLSHLLYLFVGLITGLIDSVAGGGGLISLPFLSAMIAPGPEAIGTNKIVGATGALIALIVYARKGHLLFREGLVFCLVCALGSYCGSSLTPYVSVQFFKIFLVSVCPVILWMVWNKERFFTDRHVHKKPHWILFFGAAFLSGMYDGFFGPGGGTFMFLSIYMGAGYPLLVSIAISKLANTLTASVALVNFARNGYVHWLEGSIMAAGMAVGAYIGASYNSVKAVKIVRPALTLVVVLLICKIIFF